MLCVACRDIAERMGGISLSVEIQNFRRCFLVYGFLFAGILQPGNKSVMPCKENKGRRDKNMAKANKVFFE